MFNKVICPTSDQKEKKKDSKVDRVVTGNKVGVKASRELEGEDGDLERLENEVVLDGMVLGFHVHIFLLFNFFLLLLQRFLFCI